MAGPDDAKPGAPPDHPPAHRTRHTGAQRAVLVVNVLVVLACFAGAAALIVGKRLRESFVAAPPVTYADDTATSPATTTTAAVGADTPTSTQVTASTAPAE